ncbi:PREDICTED: TIMELESS-interacting protein-like [Acropora digitifera]|uniref:TIMELESS-interacting protein-like n=1 Tax=Acropora digitifera TaxID=70779 RepID=UPI00077A3252|nr:PREDICTED: TIMELESS-interacting protein-like [Acropora digitifera]
MSPSGFRTFQITTSTRQFRSSHVSYPFNLPPPLPPLSPGRGDIENQNGTGDQNDGDTDKKEPPKKRKVNRSPRPKLDEVRLCGDRGIPALQHLCDGITFKGKGHEASDLRLLMQRYEYWAHRLFPKFPFVDVVEQVESLSAKKLVQNCIKRVRRGEEETVNDNDEDKSDAETGQNNNEVQENGVGGAGTQENGTSGVNNLQTFGAQVEANDRVVILTPEQQERIRLNREKALAKLKAFQEKQASQVLTQTGSTDIQTEDSNRVTTETSNNAKEEDNGIHHSSENNLVEENDIEMFDGLLDENTVANEYPTAKLSFAAARNEDNINIENGEMAVESADESAENIGRETSFPVGHNEYHSKASFDDDLSNPSKNLPCETNGHDLASSHAVEDTTTPFLSNNEFVKSAKQEGEVLQDEGGVEKLGVANLTANATGVSDGNELDGPSVVEMETE